MKKHLLLFCSVLLLLVISYTTAHKSWIRLSYEINKLEIIEKFCINKDETAFQCDGKCHLKTQLEKAESPDDQKKANKTEENSLTLFHINFQRILFNSFSPKITVLSQLEKIYNYLHLNSVFHPPK